MVRLNDIYGYFLNEPDIEEAYLDCYTHKLCFTDITADMLKIPRVFTRAEFLREFIKNSEDDKLKRAARQIGVLSDFQLLDYYHKNFSPWFDPDNYYSQWVVYAKKKIIDFAGQWCNSNNIGCTKKETSKFETYSYLTAYSDL